MESHWAVLCFFSLCLKGKLDIRFCSSWQVFGVYECMSLLKTVPFGTCMPGRQRMVSVLYWWSAETSSVPTWARIHPISAQTASEIESREGCISADFCLWIFVPALWRGSLFSPKVILKVKWQSFSTPLEGPSPTDKQSSAHLLFWAITFCR